jgi:hypothetical protein
MAMELNDYVSMGLGSVGTILALISLRRQRERYEGTASFQVIGLDDNNGVAYEVAVTNTGNRPLTVDKGSYWRSDDAKETTFPADITVASDSKQRIQFTVLPDQPQPEKIRIRPHKGDFFTAALNSEEASRRIFTDLLRKNLEHTLADRFRFEAGDRPNTILVSGDGVKFLLDIDRLFDGDYGMIELPHEALRGTVWSLVEGNKMVLQHSVLGPEEGVSKFYLGLSREGEDAMARPFEALKAMYVSGELRHQMVAPVVFVDYATFPGT